MSQQNKDAVENGASVENLEGALAKVKASRSSRRQFLAQTSLAGLGVVAASGAMLGSQNSASAQSNFAGAADFDILNFALNLEYLEAEFYLRAAFGTTLAAGDISGRVNGANYPTGTPGTVTGVNALPAADRVPFGNFGDQGEVVRQYAEEIALDELAHVRLLRTALGTQYRVARPNLDIGPAFTTAARAAGVVNNNQFFNPYADPISFLLGAFIFEDVGVTAYNGALGLLAARGNITTAGALLGVEAYHASEIRTLLFGINRNNDDGDTLATSVQRISDLRDGADGSGDDDQGILLSATDGNVGSRVAGEANIVPTDSSGLVYARSLRQVLSIVYLGGVTSGGFFPNGLNGRVR